MADHFQLLSQQQYIAWGLEQLVHSHLENSDEQHILSLVMFMLLTLMIMKFI